MPLAAGSWALWGSEAHLRICRCRNAPSLRIASDTAAFPRKPSVQIAPDQTLASDDLQKRRSRRRPLLQSANGEVSIEHRGSPGAQPEAPPASPVASMGVPRGRQSRSLAWAGSAPGIRQIRARRVRPAQLSGSRGAGRVGSRASPVVSFRDSAGWSSEVDDPVCELVGAVGLNGLDERGASRRAT